MRLPCIELICFCFILGICSVRMSREPKYCRAAVLELKQYNDDASSGRELINKNLEKYGFAAALAEKNGVNIIVFPEKGLFPMKMDNATWFLNYAEDIPHGKDKANPCNDDKFSDRPILTNLSCLAKTHNFYVVATLFDIKKCQVSKNCERKKNKNNCVTVKSDCPGSGYFVFNTLVVFNRKGTLVARYYKRHVFTPLEKGVDTPKYPEPAYFDDGTCKYSTDIGFDFLFNNSYIDLRNRKTSAVSYANWWFDHTPLTYFAIPNQQAWSLTNKVNVLSSDVHAPNLASLGSGIYIPDRGAVIYSYNPDGKSKLLVSNIPAKYSTSNLDEKALDTRFFYIEDDNSVNELNGEEPRDFKEECGENVLGKNPPEELTDYRCKQTEVQQYTFVKLNKTEDYIEICSNNFCCSLEYEAESMDETFYFGVSGNRLPFYGILYFGVQSCILARCEPIDGKPCRNFLLKSNTKFLNFKITGSFDTDQIYPHIMDSQLRLPDRDEWNFDGKSQMSYRNLRGNNLLYADLYGRLPERDEAIKN